MAAPLRAAVFLGRELIMFKKYIALVLVFTLLCALFAACGKESTQQTIEQHKFSMQAAIDEQTVYTDDDLTITLVSINWVEDDGLDLLFRLDDKQDRDLVLSIGTGVAVNGYVIATTNAFYDKPLSCVTLPSVGLKNVGIQDVETISINNIYVYEKGTDEIIKDQISIELKAKLPENVDVSSNMDRNVIKDGENWSMYELRQPNTHGIGTICLTNNTESQATIIVSNISVDGKPISQDVRVVSIVSWPSTICSLDIAEQIEMSCGVSRDEVKSVTADILIYNYDTGTAIETIEGHEFVK